jgi:hypothetical protein
MDAQLEFAQCERGGGARNKIVGYLLSTTHCARRHYLGREKRMVYNLGNHDTAFCDGAPAEEEKPMIRELTEVILECDLPDHGLARGDVGTVVLVHQDGKGFEVEFTTLDGETVAMVTLSASQVRVARSGEIAHARNLAQAA